jgi:deazaflavin-dependent oxidoreductase (nitroreductase family)
MPSDSPQFIKESALDRFFNRLMGGLVGFGLAPGYMRVLDVRGRKSGKIFSTPVNVLELNGRTFLVGARGQTAWARNARVAGEVTLRRGSKSSAFITRELADVDKPEIIKAFLDRFASQVQRFFKVQAGAPVDDFRPIAARTPVFELTPKS